MRHLTRSALILTLGLLLGSSATSASEQSEPLPEARPWFAVAVGEHDIKTSDNTFEFGLEFRGRPGLWGLGITGGISVTQSPSEYPKQEAFWVWAGTRRNFPLGASRKTWVTVGFAGSLYDGGDGKDAGGTFEFRTNVELSYARSSTVRLGLNLYHLSNGGIYEKNPGFNSMVVVVAFGR